MLSSVLILKLVYTLLKIVINISRDCKKLLRNKEKCKLIRVVKFPSKKPNLSMLNKKLWASFWSDKVQNLTWRLLATRIKARPFSSKTKKIPILEMTLLFWLALTKSSCLLPKLVLLRGTFLFLGNVKLRQLPSKNIYFDFY